MPAGLLLRFASQPNVTASTQSAVVAALPNRPIAEIARAMWAAPLAMPQLLAFLEARDWPLQNQVKEADAHLSLGLEQA